MNIYVRTRKLLVLICLLCIYNTIEAAPCNDTQNENKCCNTWLPCFSLQDIFSSYLWEFEVKALYLQPSCNNLSYAAEAYPLPLPSPHWKIHSIHPDYHGGFEIGLGGISYDRRSNIILNWEHLHSKDTGSRHVASSNMIGPFFEIGPDAALYEKAHGKAIFHFDAVNLNYGRFVSFCDDLHTNVYVGVGGVDIKQILSSKFSNPNGTVVRSIKIPSSFIGAGPQLGVNTFYKIYDNLHLTGEMVASLLLGRIKNHTSYKSLSPLLSDLNITPPNRQSTSVHHSTQVVPAFKGKLGIASCFKLWEGIEVDFETGYQVQVYINAIQSVDMGSEVITPPVAPDTIGVFARTFRKTVNNFSLAGPYAMFNIAF